MQIIRDKTALSHAVAALRADGGRIAFVPTMGALHAGHMSLMREGARRADHVVASIFVNPTQFGPNEDLGAYPRQEAADAAMLEAEGVAILWAPTVAEMYPTGFATSISVSGVSEGLCGAARPGHFDGVATVVAKLFNLVQPQVAVFGQKDYQQLLVIRRMVRDLGFAVEVVAAPIVREANGLAMSSRNQYLDPDQRDRAGAIHATLRAMRAGVAAGSAFGAIEADARSSLQQAGLSPDYAVIRDADDLGEPAPGRPLVALVAARIGSTRLIDNLLLTT